jgi:hypothetical protein
LSSKAVARRGCCRRFGVARSRVYKLDARYRTKGEAAFDELHVRVADTTTGELLRELTIDPTRDYQPTGAPKGPTRTKNKPEPS